MRKCLMSFQAVPESVPESVPELVEGLVEGPVEGRPGISRSTFGAAVLAFVLFFFCVPAAAQEPYPELGAKLDEYFGELVGTSAEVQARECDFLISSCADSLVRQYVTLKCYDHYLKSNVMGDDAVAVHIADEWLLSRKVAMNSPSDLMHAQIFAEFNRSSLIGMPAPSLTLFAPDNSPVVIPGSTGNLPGSGSVIPGSTGNPPASVIPRPEGPSVSPGDSLASFGMTSPRYSVLYFYDTGCSTCKVETPRLKEFVAEGSYDIDYYVIYTGADASAWEAFRADFPGVVHLWDPDVTSDWQRLYGVLQTPKMFLVGPSGTILGRGLDTPALRILLGQEFGTDAYAYGGERQMTRLGEVFSAYGDSLKVADVLGVADYMASRTFGEGNIDSFKEVIGDMLYFISSQRSEVFRDAAMPFVETYITGLPEVWSSQLDQAQVVSLGEMLVSLSSRTPVGSIVPDLTVPGVLRRKGCLFVRGTKSGKFALRSLKGQPAYVVFYTGGCSSCASVLEAVSRIVSSSRSVRVLLVDMDAVLSDDPASLRGGEASVIPSERSESSVSPSIGSVLLDTFDLSALPFVIELDAAGVIQHRYVDLSALSQ